MPVIRGPTRTCWDACRRSRVTGNPPPARDSAHRDASRVASRDHREPRDDGIQGAVTTVTGIVTIAMIVIAWVQLAFHRTNISDMLATCRDLRPLARSAEWPGAAMRCRPRGAGSYPRTTELTLTRKSATKRIAPQPALWPRYSTGLEHCSLPVCTAAARRGPDGAACVEFPAGADPVRRQRQGPVVCMVVSKVNEAPRVV